MFGGECAMANKKKRGNTTSNRNKEGKFQPAYDWSVVVPQILERIMEGESVNAFAGTEGMPCKRAIIAECLKPKWAEQYRFAMEVRAEIDGYEIDDTLAKVISGEYTPQQGKLISQMLFRRMAQRAPKKYNDHVIFRANRRKA